MSDVKRLLDLEHAVARIERKLDLILAKLEGAEETPEASPPTYIAEIEELLGKGNRIGAIKVYRYNTGVSLKAAEDAIDELDRHRPNSTPSA